MYNPFRIGRVYTDKGNKILLQATHDVLKESVNNKNIRLLEVSSSTNLELNFQVKGKFIEILLPDYAIPNTEYVLVVTNLINVVDEKLDGVFKKSIYFKTKINNKVEILRPSNHEKVKDVKIVWREKPDEGREKVNKYYLEIATDPAFYNKVLKTTIIESNEYMLSELKHRQYYVRVRAEEGKDYGPFSETITFKTDVIEEESPSVVDIDDFVKPELEEEEMPEFYEPLTITKLPEEGVTNKSFVIKFNKDIDPEVARNIRVYRRKV